MEERVKRKNLLSPSPSRKREEIGRESEREGDLLSTALVRHPVSPSASPHLRSRPTPKKLTKRRKLEKFSWQNVFCFLTEAERDWTGRIVGCSALSSLRKQQDKAGTQLFPVVFPLPISLAPVPPTHLSPLSTPEREGEEFASLPSSSSPARSPSSCSSPLSSARSSSLQFLQNDSNNVLEPRSFSSAATRQSSPTQRHRDSPPISPRTLPPAKQQNPHHSLFSAFSLRNSKDFSSSSFLSEDFVALAFSNKEERDNWLLEADEGVSLGYVPKFRVVSIHVVNVSKEDIFSLSQEDVCSMFASDVSRVLQIPFSEGEFPEVVKLFANIPLLFGKPRKQTTSKKGSGTQPAAKVDVAFQTQYGRERKRWLKWGQHIEMLCWITEDPIFDRAEYSSWGKTKAFSHLHDHEGARERESAREIDKGIRDGKRKETEKQEKEKGKEKENEKKEREKEKEKEEQEKGKEKEKDEKEEKEKEEEKPNNDDNPNKHALMSQRQLDSFLLDEHIVIDCEEL